MFDDISVTTTNTIIAGNTAPMSSPDCRGIIDSAGYNIVGNDSDCTFSVQPSDMVGSTSTPVIPNLGVLADNGGPTKTHALLPGNPAIDTGTCTDFSGATVTADQRGVSRPQGPGCDVGAFELVSEPPVLCDGLVATIVGTSGHDNLIGTAGDDVIAALEGSDVVFGMGGNDTICGGPGVDVLDGNEGDDWISGGAHGDRIRGGDGWDIILGNGGPDLVYSGGGNDIVTGGLGDDQIIAGIGDDAVYGGLGNDTVSGTEGDDVLLGGPGDDTLSCGVGTDMADGGPEDTSDSADGDCELQINIP